MLRKNGQAGMCDGSAQGLRATPPPPHTHIPFGLEEDFLEVEVVSGASA